MDRQDQMDKGEGVSLVELEDVKEETESAKEEEKEIESLDTNRDRL